MKKTDIFLAISREIQNSQNDSTAKMEMQKALDVLYKQRSKWTKETVMKAFCAFFENGEAHEAISLPHNDEIRDLFQMTYLQFLRTNFLQYKHLFPAVWKNLKRGKKHGDD